MKNFGLQRVRRLECSMVMKAKKQKKLLTTDELVELATPIPGLPLKRYTPWKLKKELDNCLERMQATKAPFAIVQKGVPLAVVCDWREFIALEERQWRLTAIMDKFACRPRVGKVPGITENEAFQKLCHAHKQVQSRKEQTIFTKARLFDEQQELEKAEGELATLEKEFRERASK